MFSSICDLYVLDTSDTQTQNCDNWNVSRQCQYPLGHKIIPAGNHLPRPTSFFLHTEVKYFFKLRGNLYEFNHFIIFPSFIDTQFTSWQIDGEKFETVRNFFFLGSQITVDGDCSHEIKRDLLLGRKAMTNLDSILKSRVTTADKGP